jgi:hypothetical protein
VDKIGGKYMENLMHEIGKRYGTDKIHNHSYHEIFPFYIEKFYDKSGGMIEIGLKEGKSLSMWLELFPRMHIYGLDISPSKISGERYTIIKADQSSESDLQVALGTINHPIYFINDDGSHIPEHQLLTFNVLFPKLESGGVYIIEDIQTSYWVEGENCGYETRYGVGHPDSLVEIFKNVVDGVNYRYSQTRNGLVEHQEHIHSVVFARNCIIINKI